MTKSSVCIYIDSSIAQKSTDLGINRSDVCNEALRLEVMRLEFVEGSDESEELAHAKWLSLSAEKSNDRLKLQQLCRLMRSPKGARYEVDYNRALRNFVSKYQYEYTEAVKIAEAYSVSVKEKVAPKEKGAD